MVTTVISVFIFFFLYLFEPFESLITYTASVAFTYAAITFVVAYSIAAILPIFFPNYFSDNNWTEGKEILHLSFVIFTKGEVNFFYAASTFIPIEGEKVYSISNFVLSISITFLIGIMPVVIVVLFNQTRLLKKYISESEKINESKHNDSGTTKEILFKGVIGFIFLGQYKFGKVE